MDMGQVRIFVFFQKIIALLFHVVFFFFFFFFFKNLIFFLWLIFALLPQIKLKQEYYAVVGSSFLSFFKLDFFFNLKKKLALNFFLFSIQLFIVGVIFCHCFTVLMVFLKKHIADKCKKLPSDFRQIDATS